MASWSFANEYVALPGSIGRRTTRQLPCKLPHTQRLQLALHYWVKWTVLSLMVASSSLAIENASADAIAEVWCGYCERQTLTPEHSDLSCTPRILCARDCPQALAHVRVNQTRNRMAAQKGRNSSSARLKLTGDDKATRVAELGWAELWDIDPNMTHWAAVLSRHLGYTS